MQVDGMRNFARRSHVEGYDHGALEAGLVLFFRIALGWTFLLGGVSQLMTPHFSVVPFLSQTKTLHALMMMFATPGTAGVVSILVEWGQTLIGLSLISGCLVRLSSPFGAMLMLLFYLAHMDWPYIQYNYNIVIDFHLIYAGLLIYLAVRRGGEVWGLDRLLLKKTPSPSCRLSISGERKKRNA